ncbi:hypothetical protein EGW08_016491 [Elysia chlorotica]|uniref:Uncharacterized protein n=1 Tax=Elysia chlorotica TaxID=188477 RepID=A0A3S1B5Y4_ELYCH|nr:hypothetical protein EGW08_016491 [Elysia chlorotica]
MNHDTFNKTQHSVDDEVGSDSQFSNSIIEGSNASYSTRDSFPSNSNTSWSTSCETYRSNSCFSELSARRPTSLLNETSSTHSALDSQLGTSSGGLLFGNSVSELPSEESMFSFFSKGQDSRSETASSDLSLTRVSKKLLMPPPPPIHADDNAVDYDISVLFNNQENNVYKEYPVSPDLFEDSHQSEASVSALASEKDLHLHLDITQTGEEESSMMKRIFAGDFSN